MAAMSAGNHAQRCLPRFAARHPRQHRHAPAHPERQGRADPRVRRRGVLHGSQFAETREFAERLAEENGYTFVHPFDDEMVIAGQGTLGLELLEQEPGLDTVVVPVGRGGLIAGTRLRPSRCAPRSRSSACRPTGSAPPRTVQRSRRTARSTGNRGRGHRRRVPRRQDLRDHPRTRGSHGHRGRARDRGAVFKLLEIEKTVTEGRRGALAAVMADPALAVGKTALVLTGGNIDMMILSSVLQRGLVRTKRLGRLTVEASDVPGSLAQVTRHSRRSRQQHRRRGPPTGVRRLLGTRHAHGVRAADARRRTGGCRDQNPRRGGLRCPANALTGCRISRPSPRRQRRVAVERGSTTSSFAGGTTKITWSKPWAMRPRTSSTSGGTPNRARSSSSTRVPGHPVPPQALHVAGAQAADGQPAVGVVGDPVEPPTWSWRRSRSAGRCPGRASGRTRSDRSPHVRRGTRPRRCSISAHGEHLLAHHRPAVLVVGAVVLHLLPVPTRADADDGAAVRDGVEDAISLASVIGSRSMTRQMPVPSLMRSVTAAAAQGAKGSWARQYISGRSPPPGNGVARLAGMWVCSGKNRLSRPRSSTARATSTGPMAVSVGTW